ncbi:MAG: hypothetical protein RL260_3161, partial [Pseudomonadota bacterium]
RLGMGDDRQRQGMTDVTARPSRPPVGSSRRGHDRIVHDRPCGSRLGDWRQGQWCRPAHALLPGRRMQGERGRWLLRHVDPCLGSRTLPGWHGRHGGGHGLPGRQGRQRQRGTRRPGRHAVGARRQRDRRTAVGQDRCRHDTPCLGGQVGDLRPPDGVGILGRQRLRIGGRHGRGTPTQPLSQPLQLPSQAVQQATREFHGRGPVRHVRAIRTPASCSRWPACCHWRRVRPRPTPRASSRTGSSASPRCCRRAAA